MSICFSSIKRILRIRHNWQCLKCFFADRFFYKKNTSFEKIILVIKTDAIGDYILFRNFLEVLRNNLEYKNYKLVFCGNAAFKNIAENLDKTFVDEFVWIDRKLLSKNTNYRKSIFQKINSLKAEITLQPGYSREFLISDSLAKASAAKQIIAHRGDNANDIKLFTWLSDFFYTKLYSEGEDLIFEFDRNKLFFELFLKEKISLPIPSLPKISNSLTEKKYAIFFPGAGEKIKQWDPKNFALVANFIFTNYGFEIKICGSSEDQKLADEIISELNEDIPFENLCGKTDLMELIALIQNANLLLTNDSSAFHIAACSGTQTLCLLMGRHYGRFAPYPNSPKNLSYVYPDSFDTFFENNKASISHLTRYNSNSKISEINPQKVISILTKNLIAV